MLSHTAADEIVVSRCVREFFRKKGMRPTHISKFAPRATMAYFLATEDDRDLREMTKTRYWGQWSRKAGGRL
jgi:hypothetical protein